MITLKGEENMKAETRKFGDFLKKLRLDSGFGLRKFSELLEMPPSNLSAVEHGRRKMPDDKLLLAADILGLEKGTKKWEEFFDLASQAEDIPVDIQSIATKGFVPALLRTIDNYQLTDDDIKNLIREIQGTDDRTSYKSC